MEKKEIIDIANKYMQIWNAGNDGLLLDFASNDLEVEYTHFQKTYQGVEEYRQVLNQTYMSFPDLKIFIDEVQVFENKALVKWTYTGSHLNGILFGVEPAGKKVKVSGLSILDVFNGKVVREYGIVDNLALVLQIGALKM
ncbi:ester cyclase [Dyadobacter sp. MSC1_007]|jgi:steroid delta-isomerase-like uncharacterized protein|uniref:ester cyclase n=1 Tax=Dyadobacter sp. MSC1_007 TaxID=2909264 RepID=UPI00202ED609|nr:ester cyclase [Dyadobacter sp. MSC1_007]